MNNIILTTFSSENPGKTALGEISWIGKTLLIKQCSLKIRVFWQMDWLFYLYDNFYNLFFDFAGFGAPCRLKTRSRRRPGEDQVEDHQAPKVCILVFLHDISWCSWNQWQRNTVLVYKHHNIGFYSTQTRSPGPSADDRVASYYRLEADDAQVIW